MKLMGNILDHEVLILVYSGASSSVPSWDTLYELSLPVESIADVRVKNGDGSKLLVDCICRRVKISMQGSIYGRCLLFRVTRC